jgi:FAD/FMN-containing dehydrogenase
MAHHPADANFAAKLRAAAPDLWLGPPEPRHLEEPRGRFRGAGGLLAKPASTAEVSTILRLCHAEGVAVLPLGGSTGLVGGQVMEQGQPLIVSLERMVALRAASPDALNVEAGMTLQAVQEAAQAQGRRFPLALASQGSAQIGGCLATNAGGVNVLRYGNARALCLGLEVVLADGTVWNGLSRLHKNNTGYDLRDLMIGAEGSLGILTATSLKLVVPPAEEGTALFALPSPEAAVALLDLAQGQLAGCISAFELIAKQGLSFLREVGPEVQFPFAADPDWMVLIELGLPAGLPAETAFAELFEAAGDLVEDAVIAQSEAQRTAFWTLRESLPVANRRIGAISSHDISVPVPMIPAFIDTARRVIEAMGPYRINCFGHVGDGNLHFNVFPPPGQRREAHEPQREAIKRAVHDIVARDFAGSVSAEHGVGRLKVEDLERYEDPAKLAMMRAIKAALDPRGILNPGAVLRG